MQSRKRRYRFQAIGGQRRKLFRQKSKGKLFKVQTPLHDYYEEKAGR